jgi:virulence factor Mce-like protein
MSRARIIIIAAAVVVTAVVALLRTDAPNTLRASFPSAINIVPGAEVRAGGVKVGTVRAIALRAGRADLELGIDDDAVWPLRRGTKASIRLGGNASYANRYIELLPAAGSAPELASGDRIGSQDATAPVEFDELFDVFDTRTRAGLGQLIDTSAATFAGRADELRAGLKTAGPTLTQIRGTFEALSEDPYALRTLVRSTAGVAGQLADHEGELGSLISDAATTLGATAGGDDDLRATLRALPGTLRAARSTLARADRSLIGVDALVRDVRPGAAELRRTAAPLRGAVRRLKAVAPDLEVTLTRLQRSGGTIAGFLTDAVPQLQRLKPVLTRLTPMLSCLRAYTPEIAGTFAGWAAFNTGFDASGRFAWLNGQALPFPNATPSSSATVAESFPQLRYSLVRPPGLNVGQPELLPACGVTQAGQDPRQDPEARG